MSDVSIEKAMNDWEENVRQKSLRASPEKKQKFRTLSGYNTKPLYTPLDQEGTDYLRDIGFPGQAPFTRGRMPNGYRSFVWHHDFYSGYGSSENANKRLHDLVCSGANDVTLALDLPSQIGLDSDDPMSRGEVGKVGVAVDTFRDFETLYEAFEGRVTLDNMSSNWTINGMANVILAMYIALAQKKGIPQHKLRGTPQNDILKEVVARGTANFTLDASMRMVRDTIAYVNKYMPQMNAISISGFHMREAGATAAQVTAFTNANAIAYVQLGVDADLDPDEFVPRHFTLLTGGGSMDFFQEIARIRASRRMWPQIMRQRFNSKNPRAWFMRSTDRAMVGNISTTRQRAINNLVRGVVGGIASALSGDDPSIPEAFDEPLGLGHSYEAMQLSLDASRILKHEAKLGQVLDPLAGSYFVESLTDQLEQEAWEIMKKIDAMGGAVEAVRCGWMEREIARSAYNFQREVETGERVLVGVNKFTGENEIDITPSITRAVSHPYDPNKRADAEEAQIAKLRRIRKERDNDRVKYALQDLREAAKNEKENLIPYLVSTVKTYASWGEIANTLRDVFGDYEPMTVL
ncbi:MAG: methylmalonyl-CoA mutase family protein [Dehalococcoidia bacterium]|nr:methylmalonyl-CoA mutase family protein [Dehalococcoidia bacterium]